jgi:hypothetical protein
MTAFNIQTVLGTGTKLRVSSNGFFIGATTAYFKWEILAADTRVVSAGVLEMDSAAFALWGNDDMYVIEWVCTKLNLTLLIDENV